MRVHREPEQKRCAQEFEQDAALLITREGYVAPEINRRLGGERGLIRRLRTRS